METLLIGVLYISLVIHIVMIAIAVWRVWHGENVIDRLLGTELVSTLMLAILVLISLIFRDSIYIDVALGLAALGYITVITFAKYITDRKMF